jgi:hypothetical protein
MKLTDGTVGVPIEVRTGYPSATTQKCCPRVKLRDVYVQEVPFKVKLSLC